MKDLRPHRDEALGLLLRDALAALYIGIDPVAWTTVEATGISRTPLPEQAPIDPTENF